MGHNMVSRLEKTAKLINGMNNFSEAKSIAFIEVGSASIDEKTKKIILDNIYRIQTIFELQKYICNSLLYFEGLSTGRYGKKK